MEPRDKKLYELARRQADLIYSRPSAYKSGYMVKLYKQFYFEKYGNDNAYHGQKTDNQGLSRWFAEDWRNQRGDIGYAKQGDIYRPTKRITKDTPTTFAELTTAQIKAAQKQKREVGRVSQFK